ncbi:PAS domain S-box protein [Clostridium sp. PL3]|uniref:Circadian input-output histidine kinase CikA n=1 Tax=Clostridium thailandense TaxID=2794346 RepID=A0A949WRB3_9CLOT|nr:PAS domain S-box protein [Clostridium thailandense]MBV7273815.1 PAS domain S-box protein [Clostridium thailandense]
MLGNMDFDSKNSFLATTLASIGDGVIATDISGNIIFFNAAAEQITGWSKNEIDHKKFHEIFELVNIVTKEILESPIDTVLKQESAIGLRENSALVTKQGEYKYISANVSPIKKNGETVSGTVTVFRDITRIRSIELELKEEQSNYMRVFNSAPVGVIVVDEKVIIKTVNKAAIDFLGSSEELSIGKKFGNAFLCEQSFKSKKGCGYSPQCATCSINIAIELALKFDLSTTNIECSNTFILNNQKNKLWFKASITPMSDGSRKNVVIVLMDITDRMNKELEVAKSRDFYLKIFENFPSIVWKNDTHGNTTYINRNWSEFTGEFQEASLDLGWLNFLHPEDREKCYERHKKSINKRQPYDIEYRMMHKSGEYKWIQSINRPFYDIDGKFDGYIGMGVDITDRKIAEEGLKRYEILSESVTDIIHFIDIKGNVIGANEAALRSYGYTHEEFLKLNIRNLRAEGHITDELLKKCYKEGMFYETIHYRKDNSTFPVEISSKGAVIGGQEVIVSIIRDITERKATENSLKAAKEDAEVANKTKSEFLANMSHEIRTPINGIVGMVDLTLLTQLNSEQKENLTVIKSCAKSLLKVINDILDFSKMEAGKLVIENINFDIKSLIEETIKFHLARASEKGIELNYIFSKDIPKFVFGDPGRLQQILNNLISNAIKFTEVGEVLIKIDKVKIENNEVELQFVVEDSGIGIAEENIERLFKSFSQIDSSITREFGGTGLGLAISKQLSEIMGGRLWVESKKEIGSKFYLTLKFGIGNTVETQSVDKIQLKKVDKTYKLLLAEDDKINQIVITRILKELGYFVDAANNGLEAVEMCEKNSYDAILMDIQMPLMDGIEASRKIREKNKITPIIAITAYALKGDRERFLAQGMNEYVSKPIETKQLVNTVEKAIHTSRNFSFMSNISDVSICIGENGEVSIGLRKNGYDDEGMPNLNELSKAIDSLDNAIYKREINMIEILAHRIKNLANELGIEELKTSAFKVELSARRGNYDDAINKVQNVRRIFNVLKNQLS